MVQEKVPRHGIVDVISPRHAAAGKFMRGGHAAHRGVPTQRHAAGSDQADGTAAQCHRADGKSAERQQPDAYSAKRKNSDAQGACGDGANGNAAAGI